MSTISILNTYSILGTILILIGLLKVLWELKSFKSGISKPILASKYLGKAKARFYQKVIFQRDNSIPADLKKELSEVGNLFNKYTNEDSELKTKEPIIMKLSPKSFNFILSQRILLYGSPIILGLYLSWIAYTSFHSLAFYIK